MRHQIYRPSCGVDIFPFVFTSAFVDFTVSYKGNGPVVLKYKGMCFYYLHFTHNNEWTSEDNEQ